MAETSRANVLNAGLAQATSSTDALLQWRSSITFDGSVCAEVMVLPSPTMARKLSADVPQLAVPDAIIDRLDRDRESGIDIACEHIMAIVESEAFDGIHLIPVHTLVLVAVTDRGSAGDAIAQVHDAVAEAVLLE